MAGCASSANRPQATGTPPTHLSPASAVEAAKHYLPPDADPIADPSAVLSASDTLIRGGYDAQSLTYLNRLHDVYLSPDLLNQKYWQLSQIYWRMHETVQAHQALKRVNPKRLSSAQQWNYYRLQEALFEHTKQPIKALQAQWERSTQLKDPKEKSQALQSFWRACYLLTEKQTQPKKQYGPQLSGWLSLNQVFRQTGDFALSYYSWQQHYHGHPAKAEWLPIGFQGVIPPKKIAILLPASGRRLEQASAIQEGILSSYYQDEDFQPELLFIDTEKSGVSRAYQKAVEQGADRVIGPLTKKEVNELLSVKPNDLPVQTLALNRPSSTREHANVVVLDLALDNEIDALVAHLHHRGYTRFALLAPQSTFGERLAAHFSTALNTTEQQVLTQVFYEIENDPAVAVRQLLDIDSSQDRLTRIRQLAMRKVHFEPRRRLDVEAIVLLAPPEDARQLRPLLDFYYAEDLPVFSTSWIYQGYPSPKEDRDINGVSFCDMPALINKHHPNYAQIKALRDTHPQASPQEIRLWALGMDAYRLAMDWDRMVTFAEQGYPGATGYLFLNAHNQLERFLPWVTMRQGQPELIH